MKYFRPNFIYKLFHTSFLVFFFFIGLAVYSQDTPIELSWDQLKSLQFEESYDESTGGFYQKPKFGMAQKALEGKKVKITGYVLPMDAELNYYVVSAFPFASCFFCGGVGPESVMDLKLKDQSLKFKNDERVSFCGILRLNEGNVFELPYILNEAEVCEE